MTTTLNRVLTAFKTLALNHYQINSSFVGQEWDFQSKENLYPCLMVITQPGNIQRGRILYGFQLYFLDILNKDSSNLYEIESDMFQVATDFIAELKDKEDIYGFTLDDTDVLITPVEEVMDDILAGQRIDIQIECVYDGSSCNTAFMNNYYPIPGESLPTINYDIFHNFLSGLQGGYSGYNGEREFYHLTKDQWGQITGGTGGGGASGYSGYSGYGTQGIDGANSTRYILSSGSCSYDIDPGFTYFTLDSYDFTGITCMNISKYNKYNVDFTQWVLDILVGTTLGPTKIQITDIENQNNFGVYTAIGTFDDTYYSEFSMTLISGNGVLETGKTYTISYTYAINGGTGADGTSGYSGYSGRSGYSGYSGRSGYSGAVGAQGPQGYQGPPGPATYPGGGQDSIQFNWYSTFLGDSTFLYDTLTAGLTLGSSGSLNKGFWTTRLGQLNDAEGNCDLAVGKEVYIKSNSSEFGFSSGKVANDSLSQKIEIHMSCITNDDNVIEAKIDFNGTPQNFITRDNCSYTCTGHAVARGTGGATAGFSPIIQSTSAQTLFFVVRNDGGTNTIVGQNNMYPVFYDNVFTGNEYITINVSQNEIIVSCFGVVKELLKWSIYLEMTEVYNAG